MRNYLTQFDGYDSGKGFRFKNPLDTGFSGDAAVYYDAVGVIKDYHLDKVYHPVDFVMAVEECGYREAIEIVGELKPKQHHPINSVQEVQVPEGFRDILSAGVMGDRVRKYVQDRGFDVEDLFIDGFGYSMHPDWIGYLLIPFEVDGRVVYYQGRSVTGREPKYKNIVTEGYGKSDLLYNEVAVNYETCFLVEGWACARTIDGAAYLGKSMSERQISKVINGKCEKVIIIPDYGAWQEGLEMASRILKYKKVGMIKLEDERDINDRGGVDLNECMWVDRSTICLERMKRRSKIPL